MLRVETLEEAEAAARAGVELLSVPPAMIHDRRFREAAPDAFAFPGDNFYEIGGTDDFLRWALPLVQGGRRRGLLLGQPADRAGARRPRASRSAGMWG